eukprot:TRINITY_DN3925_c0_g1_i3.p1 TRINITY_DN3925_c0_g1~~TRINITY_DN3925_c0_g1_i3.p1  ORF type:complete len:194 (+),score=14.69 TRINITY_DN3925_c0_g1_i3:70-651(+)
MAIEDMSSLPWMGCRQRRLREQNRGGAEDQVPDSSRTCNSGSLSNHHRGSPAQQAPPDNMTAHSPSTSSQRRGVEHKQKEASSPERRFDPTNARHRLVDLELKQRMMEKGSLEQLLSYLVRGAVDWYMRGGLGETPTAMKASLNQYLASNDKLQKFIEDHCAIREELRAPMMNFLKSYRDARTEVSPVRNLAT